MTDASSLKPVTDGRKVWQKNAYDVADQTTSTATNVGFLRQNDSRIDVISTMDKNLKQQVFSFQSVTTANTQLATQVSTKGDTVRVQLLNQAGQVVADSKSGMGQASKTYNSLVQGTYNLKQGKYFVVVQRGTGVPLDSQLAFNVQISQGSTVKNDYISENVPVPAKIQQQQALAAVQQIAPTALSSTSSSILGATSTDPFGLGGYDIFGQKTSS